MYTVYTCMAKASGDSANTVKKMQVAFDIDAKGLFTLEPDSIDINLTHHSW